ncbi:MAG: universal stress protein [Rhodospirillales bacterium]
MANIVAFIDGSTYARSVCDHTAWIAARCQAPVELYHILGRRETDSAPANLSGSIALGARTALLQELSQLDAERGKLLQKRGRALLEDAEDRLKAAGCAAVSLRLRFGDLVETLDAIAEETEILVIGKRGEAANFAKGHLGSNLERVVRASHRPVFVAARAFTPPQRFLIAYDGGVSSLKAVDYIARSPLFAGLACHVLTVGPEGPEAQRRLDDAKATLAAGGYAVTTEIAEGQPDKVIAEAVEQRGMDLLVMGAYGHARIRSLIIGSTTTAMVRLCKVPVVLFR